MINSKLLLVRKNDEYFVHADIQNIDVHGDYVALQVSAEKSQVILLSTVFGFISDNKIFVGKEHKNASFDFKTDARCVDLIISGYQDSLVTSSQSITVAVPKIPLIQKTRCSPLKIKTLSNNYKDKMNEFNNIVRRRKSACVVNLNKEACGDFSLSVLSEIKHKTLMCLGEKSEQLLSSDVIFYLYPGSRIINIPIGLCSNLKEISISELVVPDFLPDNHSYFKLSASNTIGLSC